MLIARVSNTDMTWHKDVLPSPRSYHQLDLTLDDNTVLKAIEHMNFIQMKSTYLLIYDGILYSLLTGSLMVDVYVRYIMVIGGQ